MALPELEEQANNTAFSVGMLLGWLALPCGCGRVAPAVMLEHVRTVDSGVDHWRNKYYQANEDLISSNGNYQKLTVSYAELVQRMALLQEQYDELLLEQQRDLHKKN